MRFPVFISLEYIFWKLEKKEPYGKMNCNLLNPDEDEA